MCSCQFGKVEVRRCSEQMLSPCYTSEWAGRTQLHHTKCLPCSNKCHIDSLSSWAEIRETLRGKQQASRSLICHLSYWFCLNDCESTVTKESPDGQRERYRRINSSWGPLKFPDLWSAAAAEEDANDATSCENWALNTVELPAGW